MYITCQGVILSKQGCTVGLTYIHLHQPSPSSTPFLYFLTLDLIFSHIQCMLFMGQAEYSPIILKSPAKSRLNLHRACNIMLILFFYQDVVISFLRSSWHSLCDCHSKGTTTFIHNELWIFPCIASVAGNYLYRDCSQNVCDHLHYSLGVLI